MEKLLVELAVEARERVVQDDPVGATCDRYADEGVGVADVLARARHRAQTDAAGRDDVPSMSNNRSFGMGRVIDVVM